MLKFICGLIVMSLVSFPVYAGDALNKKAELEQQLKSIQSSHAFYTEKLDTIRRLEQLEAMFNEVTKQYQDLTIKENKEKKK